MLLLLLKRNFGIWGGDIIIINYYHHHHFVFSYYLVQLLPQKQNLHCLNLIWL